MISRCLLLTMMTVVIALPPLAFAEDEPELSPSDKAKLALVDELMPAVEKARGLKFKVPFKRKLLTPKEIMPHSVYRLYAWLKRRIRRTVSASHLTIINYCEQAPDPQSRIYLAEDRDALGMRSLVLDWRIGDEERRSIKKLHEELGAAVVKAGIGVLETNLGDFSDLRFTDASHHIGTLRMSASPKIGVVDENCGVHGIDNLFAAGSAVFPTAGHANPTLTITALALRLADHLRKLRRATV